jgi:hypothetical protein
VPITLSQQLAWCLPLGRGRGGFSIWLREGRTRVSLPVPETSSARAGGAQVKIRQQDLNFYIQILSTVLRARGRAQRCALS